MSQRRFGLRLRVLATLSGAAGLCGALLSVLLLLRARDEIARSHLASARRDLRAAAAAVAERCAGEVGCAKAEAARSGVLWEPACVEAEVSPGRLTLCEKLSQGALRRDLRLAAAASQARALIAPVLGSVALGMLLLVGLLFVLLDRQLIAPLARIDAALDRISAGDEPLLAEGGDLLGRLAPAVNRLDHRLREERSRVQAQIAQLSQSNADLRAAREEVARGERLASVGRLAAGVAHEVGNPMTALIGFLGILKGRLEQGRDPGDYVERIEREAERIDRILRDLLNLARPPIELSAVDLRAAAERARGLVEAQPGWSGRALELRVPEDLPRAKGDDHYVVQVLVNLLVNAAKAGASKVEVAGRVDAGAPVVEVLDDGRGLPPEAASRLFEPFFTTSGPGEGTGLGLALCHATMERFGGSISARPRQGMRGSAFTLRFAPWQRA